METFAVYRVETFQFDDQVGLYGILGPGPRANRREIWRAFIPECNSFFDSDYVGQDVYNGW